jgi:hypothetical protein
LVQLLLCSAMTLSTTGDPMFFHSYQEVHTARTVWTLYKYLSLTVSILHTPYCGQSVMVIVTVVSLHWPS